MPRISDLPAIADSDIDNLDLLPLVDAENDTTSKLTLLQLKNFIGGGAINVPNKVFVDSVFGDDGTGLRERMDKPFQSGAAAVAAAQVGDVVVFRGGTHFVFSSLMKVGVNLWGDFGSIINIFGLAFDLDTTAGGLLLNGRISFLGYAEINDLDGSGGGVCVIRNNPDAILDIQCNKLNVQNISNGMVIRDGTLNLEVREGDYYSKGRNFSMRETGKVNAFINGNCITDFASVFNGNVYASATNWSGYLKVKCRKFVQNSLAANQAGVYLDNCQSATLNMEFDELENDAIVSTWPWMQLENFGNTQSVINLTVKNILQISRPLYKINHSGHQLFLNNIVGIYGGSNHIDGRVVINSNRTAITAPKVQSGGVCLVRDTDIINVAATVAFAISNGTLSVMGSTIVTDGIANSIDNIGGTVLSEGSKANVDPSNPVTGNLYVNPLYVN